MAGYRVSANYPDDADANLTTPGEPVKTGDDGRFIIGGLMPGVRVALSFQQPKAPFMSSGVHTPDAARRPALGAGEIRDIGDIQVKPRVVPSALSGLR